MAIDLRRKYNEMRSLWKYRRKFSLWDEDDTFYCSKCAHRTLYETGEDDLVECPYCHEMKDRKAHYCRHCNEVWLD